VRGETVAGTSVSPEALIGTAPPKMNKLSLSPFDGFKIGQTSVMVIFSLIKSGTQRTMDITKFSIYFNDTKTGKLGSVTAFAGSNAMAVYPLTHTTTYTMWIAAWNRYGLGDVSDDKLTLTTATAP